MGRKTYEYVVYPQRNEFGSYRYRGHRLKGLMNSSVYPKVLGT